MLLIDSGQMAYESRIQATVATDDRRVHERIAGPFDGRRIGALDTPVSIYDLSEGGCFINSTHEQKPGVQFTLEIDLPFVGCVTVKAESLYDKPEFGFAARFVDVTMANSLRLKQGIEELKNGGYSSR